MVNYLSQKLIDSANDIYDNCSKKNKMFLNTIVKNIMKIIDNHKYFYKDFVTIDQPFYPILQKTSSITLTSIHSISISKTILKHINKMNLYILEIGDKKIKIYIYYNSNDNEDILKQNIHKIMTRLYNLHILYKMDILDYEFYLYNNPRRANKDMYGKKYLNALYKSSMKYFNTCCGVTAFRKNKVIVSRTEDCIGLLTHEVLHVAGLINIDSNMMIHGIEINFTEAFVNMFASIVNVYLTVFEYNMTKDNLHKLLLIELIHSILHSIKLARISGYSLHQLMNTDNLNWYQEAYLYEYIIIKMCLFINFNDIMQNEKFANAFFSRELYWDQNDTQYNKMIEDKFNDYKMNSNDLIDEINKLHNEQLDLSHENNKIGGNMIMQYNALDMMIIEKDKQYNELYGGGRNITYKKYLQMKINYIKLKLSN